MARILSQERSLSDRRELIDKELGFLGMLTRYVEWPLTVVLLISGGIIYFAGGRSGVLIGGVVALFLTVSHQVKMRESSREKTIIGIGRRGEAKVSQKLGRELPHNCYVLNDLMILHGRKSAQIDHIVLTPQGMFLLETKTWGGRITGDPNDQEWTLIRDDGRKPAKRGSPVKQSARHDRVVRDHLDAAGIKWPDIESCVVFASGGSQIEVKGSEYPLLHIRDVADYIIGYTGSKTYSEEEIDAVLNLFMKENEG